MDINGPEAFNRRWSKLRPELVEEWLEFEKVFPTDKECMNYILDYITEDGALLCWFCVQRIFPERDGSRSFKCHKCGRPNWLTAETTFARLNKLKPSFGAAWLLENGHTFNAAELSQLAGVANSTALVISRKLALVIEDCADKGEGNVESGEFLELFLRRSVATPEGKHPSAEEESARRQLGGRTLSVYSSQENLEGGKELRNDSSPETKFDGKSNGDQVETEDFKECGSGATGSNDWSSLESEDEETNRMILGLLAGAPVHFDQICYSTNLKAGELQARLVALELNGLIARVYADSYVSTKSDWIVKAAMKDIAERNPRPQGFRLLQTRRERSNIGCQEFCRWLSTLFGGISRRFLQLYVWLKWCSSDRSFWSSGRLLRACLAHPPIRAIRVRNYLTPLNVVFPTSTSTSR